MDCFFVAIEIKYRALDDARPTAVGSELGSRGVISTCNYSARKFGVKSGISASLALQLCPELLILKGNFRLYRRISSVINKIFYQYTNNIEMVSIDEAYLDVTNSRLFNNNAVEIAQDIKDKIYQTTGLVASCGIAQNKLLAKIASEIDKPNGLFVISPNDSSEFIKKIPVRSIPGIGRATEDILYKLNIKICEDLQNYDLKKLNKIFGRQGEFLYKRCRGIDERELANSSLPKSISVEHTYDVDLQSLSQCMEKMSDLISCLKERIRKKNIDSDRILKLFVKLKFYNFDQTTSEGLYYRLDFNIFCNLLEEAWMRGRMPVRLIGVGIKVKDESILSYSQTELGL